MKDEDIHERKMRTSIKKKDRKKDKDIHQKKDKDKDIQEER